VDPPGDHAVDCGPGPYDPYPCPYDRDHQQVLPRLPAPRPGNGPRADPRRGRPGHEDAGWKVKGILKIAQEPISLQTPIGDEGDTTFGDFIEDKTAVSPANATAYSMLKEQMDDVLLTLTEREEKVLRLRFGIGDGYPRTLEEVGHIFNVTRERVRQIEAKALRKLRHPTRARKLKNFLDIKLSE